MEEKNKIIVTIDEVKNEVAPRGVITSDGDSLIRLLLKGVKQTNFLLTPLCGHLSDDGLYGVLYAEPSGLWMKDSHITESTETKHFIALKVNLQYAFSFSLKKLLKSSIWNAMTNKDSSLDKIITEEEYIEALEARDDLVYVI